jgi:hypothetical protein
VAREESSRDPSEVSRWCASETDFDLDIENTPAIDSDCLLVVDIPEVRKRRLRGLIRVEFGGIDEWSRLRLEHRPISVIQMPASIAGSSALADIDC